MTNDHGPETSLTMAQGIVRSFSRNSPKIEDKESPDQFAEKGGDAESNDDAIEVMVTSREGGIGIKHRFEDSFVLIGRSPECDLSLPDDHVSSRHAYLQKIFGRVVCVDLASSNGTYWPEGRRPFGWFDEEHPISIGKYHLRLASQSPREELSEPEFDPGSFFKTDAKQPEAPNVSLQHLSDTGRDESWMLSRHITLVGNSACCKLRLQHPSVSRVHCSLILLPEGLWIVDLLGNEGTSVNDEQIRSARLADGDVFQVGKYAFRVSYLPPEPAADSNLLVPDHALSGKVISNEFAGKLLEQVMAMQQQFLQQSQKQTEMMLQFFSTLHTQQHELLSQEMARVREIDRELRELRAGWSRQAGDSDNRQSSMSAANGADPSEGSRTGDPPRLKHIRTAGPPCPEESSADREPAQANAKNSPAVESAKQADALDAAGDSAESSHEASQQEPSTDDSAKLRAVAAKIDEMTDVAESLEDALLPDAGDAEDEEDFADETSDVPPDQITGQNQIDHHSWVMSRMHQLERERDGILRKMMRAVFKPNS